MTLANLSLSALQCSELPLLCFSSIESSLSPITRIWMKSSCPFNVSSMTFLWLLSCPAKPAQLKNGRCTLDVTYTFKCLLSLKRSRSCTNILLMSQSKLLSQPEVEGHPLRIFLSGAACALPWLSCHRTGQGVVIKTWVRTGTDAFFQGTFPCWHCYAPHCWHLTSYGAEFPSNWSSFPSIEFNVNFFSKMESVA